eukprot:SAG31_NODE_491_length_14923_cov_12.905221_2_plen_401_part_00
MPDRVLQAMHRGSPNIYEGELLSLTDHIFEDLRAVARTEHNVVLYIGNGHAAWEAALANTLSEGDLALVLSAGTFAAAWAVMAESLGVICETMSFGMNKPIDPTDVGARLAADTEHKIKAVLVCQTDTASSVHCDIGALRRSIDKCTHPALFMVDCVASLGCSRFEMDRWMVDIVIAGSQKGLMTPAGVAFNFFSPKALAARRAKSGGSGQRVSAYWDWLPRIEPGNPYYYKFGGTAPTHHLFGLAEALQILLREEKIENVWSRHELFAKAVWAAVECWGSDGPMRLNISDPAHRSVAVTTVWLDGLSVQPLRDWCQNVAGLTLGVAIPGLSQNDEVFRIGHMGHLNPPMLLGMLATIEAGLIALGIPHGAGAMPAANAVIARGTSNGISDGQDNAAPKL